MDKGIFKTAKWIGGDRECQSPIIKREFSKDNIKKAVLYVTGLGYFEAKINGASVTEDRLIPVASNYEHRNLEKLYYPLKDNITFRIYYYSFDVTHLLKKGTNTLTIQLGNGWYRQKERIAEGETSFSDDLKAIYKLELLCDDGVIELCSDGGEKYTNSEIVYNNIFIGEVIDPNTDLKTERNVKIFSDIESELSLSKGTPDRIIRAVKPVLIGKVNGKKIYDAGENISGVVRAEISIPKGEKVTLRFAEKIKSDNSLDFLSTGADYKTSSGIPQIMTDVFVSDGTRRSFTPKFVWHTFRYFEVDGEVDDIEVLVIHSNTAVTSTFESSSEALNFLFDAFVRTQLINMHGSFPSDCPHRERLGYTGDGQVCTTAAMLTLDSREFYRKWIDDILDSQDKNSGHSQHTAPLMGGGGGPGGWSSAIVLVPYYYFKQYGEVEMLEKCYPAMRKWVEYLKSHSENGLVVREEEGGWCLGEWNTPEKVQLPPEYINSVYFIKLLKLMSEIALIINKNDEIIYLKELAQNVTSAVNSSFCKNGSYFDGIQGADAFAVWAGIADIKTAQKVSQSYEDLGRFDTGFLGTDVLMEVLFCYGYENTALKLLENEGDCSFLKMKRSGATTLWEYWSGGNSWAHPFLGGCTRQLFSSVLGITQDSNSYGYEKIVISPKIPDGLRYAKGSTQTVKGRISVSWEREGNGINFKVKIPDGETGLFKYNSKSCLFKNQLEITV